MQTFVACGAAFAICALTLTFRATVGEIIAASCGLAALAAVTIIRRLGLGPWSIAAIAVPALGIAISLAASHPSLRTRSVSLAFAVRAPASLTSMSQRMLDDAPLAGTGAGTVAAIMPIYSNIDDPMTDFAAPTVMSALAIQLGKPMQWLIVAAVAGTILVLLNASFHRGRDSFYPANGASCLITLLLLSFMNPGLLGTAVGIIAAAVLGLAFGQSRSRTIQA
jgi:hypothetical protein